MRLRLGFVFAAYNKREEIHVDRIIGICKARSERGCAIRYLSGQGGFRMLVRLWKFVRHL